MTEVRASISSTNNVTPTSNDNWQKVIALDASYLRQRSRKAPHLNPARWSLYLRRRYQLSQCNHPENNVDRSEYLYIRQNLFAQKYGPTSLSTTNDDGSVTPTGVAERMPFNVLLLDAQQRHSLSQFSTSSSTSQAHLTETLMLHNIGNSAPVSKGYSFAGIETVFDHHKDSITRICFAHNDSQHLAIASTDGTASICHLSSTTTSYDANSTSSNSTAPPSCRIDYLRPPPAPGITASNNLPPAALMDVAWSLANDFVATASLDGSLCLWTVKFMDGEGGCKLARHFPNLATPEEVEDQGQSGSLMVCEFHPLNNNFIVVGDTMGVVQVLNLSTGHVVKGGRDCLHPLAPPMSRRRQRRKQAHLLPPPRLPPCRSRTDLSHRLGHPRHACVTALAFDPLSARLWAASDRGAVQAFACHEASGALSRLARLDLAGGPGGTSFLPSVTSLAFCAWLSREDAGAAYMLANVAGMGLLLFEVDVGSGKLALRQKFELQHTPLCNPPASNYGLHLLHSCFAPLISFRSSGTACAISASEDRGSVCVFEVSTASARTPTTTKPNAIDGVSGKGVAAVTRLQGHDCAVGRTVVDVCLAWDESLLASADEAGLVIVWRRQASSG